jgi:GT2 family glycosyltransferase
MIYVGIVTFNSVDDLPTCFAALERQVTSDHEISVMVLDNCSTDESVQWIKDCAPDATLLIAEANMGFGRGHNQILQTCHIADTDYYLALNPDVQLEADYVQNLIETIDRNKAGWAIGKLLSIEADRRTVYSVGHALLKGGYAFNIGHEIVDTGQFETEREVFGAPGAAVLISGRLIHALAPNGVLFDPNFFLYHEDVDFDWAARKQGWRCWYQPTALAYHRGSNPYQWLRNEALCNRYLSVVKNAYLSDLVLYNLPLMCLHFLCRIALTPREGVQIIRLFMSRVSNMWRRRTTPVVSRAEMHRWFKWSQQQTSGEAVSLTSRLHDFLNRRVI